MEFSLDRFYRINRRAIIWIVLFALVYFLRSYFLLIFLTFIIGFFAIRVSRFLMERPRFFMRSGAPFLTHYLGNRLIIWLTNTLYGFRATDYEGCYKAFTRAVIQRTPVDANGFEFDNELICKLLRQGCRIVEVPIHYSPRLYSEGKKIRWTDGLRMLWTIIRCRFWQCPELSKAAVSGLEEPLDSGKGSVLNPLKPIGLSVPKPLDSERDF